jgi:acetolactate synthase-1/2/3 large subunit
LHQELKYLGRVIGTELVNPDFSRLAQAFGAKGLTIRTAQEALPMVCEALASDGAVVVDVRASLKHISAYTSLEKLRNA